MKIHENYNTNQLSWIHIGGKSKYFIELFNNDDLIDAIKYCIENKLRYRFIGGGTNIYFGDFFDGALLKMSNDPNDTSFIDIFKKYHVNYSEDKDDYYIVVPAYLNLCTIIYHVAELNFDLSNMYGIPGTIGGAVINNAGAYGSEIGDYVSEVICYNENGIKKYTKEAMQFDYRSSFLKDKSKDIVVSIFLQVQKSQLKSDEIIRKCNKIQEIRKSKFPTENNLGSVFQNYLCNDSKIAVGAMLDKIQTKMLKFNNLSIHEKHSNVIVNQKKDNDIESMDNMILEIEKRIFSRYGIKLNVEIQKIM